MNLERIEELLNEREDVREKLNEVILSQTPAIDKLEAERAPYKKRMYEITRILSLMNYREEIKIKKIASLPTKRTGRKPKKRK